MKSFASANRPVPCRLLLGAVLAIAATWMAAPATAQPLPEPTERVLLTISGNIERTNSPEGARFDFGMLQELGLVSRRIDTEWTEGGTVFEGVLTRTLLEHVGARGEWVRASAANDYSANVPLSDLTEHDTLLALSRDGKRMSLRDKGPAWILYDNRDRPPVSQNELNDRMVWQLKSLVVF